MTAWALSLTVFVALLFIGLAMELWAWRWPRFRAPVPAGVRLPRAAPSLAAAMRTTPGRVAVFAWWLWLGIHFLAR